MPTDLLIQVTENVLTSLALPGLSGNLAYDIQKGTLTSPFIQKQTKRLSETDLETSKKIKTDKLTNTQTDKYIDIQTNIRTGKKC